MGDNLPLTADTVKVGIKAMWVDTNNPKPLHRHITAIEVVGDKRHTDTDVRCVTPCLPLLPLRCETSRRPCASASTSRGWISTPIVEVRATGTQAQKKREAANRYLKTERALTPPLCPGFWARRIIGSRYTWATRCHVLTLSADTHHSGCTTSVCNRRKTRHVHNVQRCMTHQCNDASDR